MNTRILRNVATTEMTETKVGVKPRASSLINDADDEADWNSARRTLNVRYVTVALWCACCAYILAVFQAVPISLHFQVGGTSLPNPISRTSTGAPLARCGEAGV